MKTKLSLPSILLVLQGLLLVGLGLYFVFVRPPLLPEDPRFMGASLVEIQVTMPGLLIWLRRVFWVMGGFMFSTGILMTYIATVTFPHLMRSGRSLIALASFTSIGWMAVINFMINSDFKWLLLVFNLPWIFTLILSYREGLIPASHIVPEHLTGLD
jgi:hypothetical protein